MTDTRHVILATAGHVDHGKSALVRALTGIDPDRLPEEKARGITIELGFAHLRIEAPPVAYQVGIVDVPGHEDFVKNMVAGVGSIDLALLVVAADDGWMPQTEEHLQILSYLGVGRAVVALTKADLVASADAAVGAVRENLRGSAFADAAIVPTSVSSGAGLEELKQALAATLAVTPPPRDIGKPRLPLDRVFSLKGVGTVVTGTLTGGALRQGQEVVVQPGGRPTRVRNLQTHNRDVPQASPGSRVALNLPDLEPRGPHDALGEAVVGRGDVITLRQLGRPTDTLDVLLERSARASPDARGPHRPLKEGALVQIHHGTAAYACRVHFLDVNQLLPGQTALAQLRLQKPIFAFDGDRFVVRDWPEQHTLAGGTILDCAAQRAARRDDARRRFLSARAASPDDPAAFVASHLDRYGAAPLASLLVRSRFSADEISQACSRLVDAGHSIRAGDYVCQSAHWQHLWNTAAAVVDAWHQAHPEQAGITSGELAKGTPADPDLFQALVKSMCEKDFVQTGATLRRATHHPRLPARLQSAGERLRRQLAERPFDPPSRKELAPDPLAQQALRFLTLNGEAVDLGPEQILSAPALSQAVDRIRAYIRQHGPATVAQLKEQLRSSRRIMVPLLEKLDRDGVTRREGDRRVLR